MYKLLYTLIVFFGLLCSCINKKIETEKPNILLIFTDDQKWNTINALGNPDIHTPNMDKLVDGAMVFRNAYCFGGNTGAVCIPSRNMLMSGRTFFRFEEDSRQMEARGEEPRKIYYTNPDWPTMPKAMKEAGYETYFREKSGSANNPVVRTQFDHFGDINMVEELRTGRPAKRIIDDAVRFITQERNKSKPFFMYLGISAPHDPRWALKKFRDMYNEEDMKIPESYLPQHPWVIGNMTIRDESLEKWPRTQEDIRRHLFDYYATVTAMDYDFGQLIDVLEEQGLTENTIIIFSSDQGLALGEHGLMGKQNIYEGTMKVPFFVKGPGIKEGETDAFVYLHDIFPSLCDWAQSDIPQGLDGLSILPLINREQEEIRDKIFLAYRDYQRSIRKGNWKLIRFPKIDKTLLFNLENDPNEINNLADDPQYTSLIKELFTDLDKERKAAGDHIELFSNEYTPAEFVAPTVKLKTPYPAGGLAPLDPSFNSEKNSKK